jgi:hypothetical protein
MTKKVHSAEGSKLPQSEITYSNNSTSVDINFSECFPNDRDLTQYRGCVEVCDSYITCGRIENDA